MKQYKNFYSIIFYLTQLLHSNAALPQRISRIGQQPRTQPRARVRSRRRTGAGGVPPGLINNQVE